MKQKYLTRLKEIEDDDEFVAMTTSYRLLSGLSFDGQWRVINYLIVRLWNRSWMLNRPKNDL